MTKDINEYIRHASKKELEFLLYFHNTLKEVENDPISVELQFDKLRLLCEQNKFHNSETYFLSLVKLVKMINYDSQTKIIRMLPNDYKEILKILETNRYLIEEKIFNSEKSKFFSTENNRNDLFDEEELIAILKYMYDSAPSGYQMTMVHLFGIKYADVLTKHKVKNIAIKATGRDSLYVEIGKRMKLSKYVNLLN